MRSVLLLGAVALTAFAIACSNTPAPQTVAVTHPVGAAAVDKARIMNSLKNEPGSWLTAGGDYDEQRYSPLKQLDTTTVKNISLAWYGDIDTERGQEATPVIVDGMMYVTSAWSMVKAYDISTGKKVWEYDPKVDKAKGADACCDVVNRGVAVWKGNVIVAALDGRLISLNGKTGAVTWESWTVPKGTHHTITGVPRIANDKIIIGNAGAEYDVRGNIAAFDAATGKMVWNFYTVPGDPSKPYEQPILKEAAKTWKGDVYWKQGGGATVWDGILYDPDTNLVFFGTGNGLSWAQELRSPGGGDNLFVSSIVAVDADTGMYKWHYQETPGDEWDYDNTNPLMIADLKYPDGVKHVVMQAPKNGFYYILEAKTGKLLSAEKFQPMTNWASHIDMKTGRPVENPAVRYSATNSSAYLAPAALGMHNWHPMAMSPDTGYIYIPTQVSAGAFAMKDGFEFNEKGTNTGNDGAKGRAAVCGGANVCGNIESYILAWDPVKGKEVWRIKNEIYGSSGILATAGNLIFSGNHKGEFAAYNATTGERVWKTDTQARIVAAPSTYMANGKQHVAILVGARGLPAGGKRTSAVSANNSRLLVFAEGGTAQLPTTEVSAAAVPARVTINPPLSTASNEAIFEGEALYGSNCAMCHGPTGIPGAGATAPDLRYSGLLTAAQAPTWNATVRDGDRASRGMPGFSRLRKDETDAILSYIIKRANDEKAAQEAAVRRN